MAPSSYFHLPWNQADNYWLVIIMPDTPAAAEEALMAAGMQPFPNQNGVYVLQAPRMWGDHWRAVRRNLSAFPLVGVEGAAVPTLAGNAVDFPSIQFHRKPLADIDKVADALWLGDGILEENVKCYLQPIVDKRGQVFGQEAFARMETSNGTVIGGGKIIDAARTLNVEHTLDRYLHVQAVKTYVTCQIQGFLFINFVPGFIHRPEVYLEKMTETVNAYGMPAKNLALEFTQSEVPKDLTQLKSIFEYCRSKNYATSLDDVESVEGAKRLIVETKPNFMKLDVPFVRRAHEPEMFAVISEIVDVAHTHGTSVIAEGVETDDTHKILMRAGVDLFQGYLFSPPVAVSPPTQNVSV